MERHSPPNTFLGAIKPKDLNRIVKIVSGHLRPRENLSFDNNYIN
jgi:hypothetical protein